MKSRGSESQILKTFKNIRKWNLGSQKNLHAKPILITRFFWVHQFISFEVGGNSRDHSVVLFLLRMVIGVVS